MITPWTIDANGNNKCDGTPITVNIWVEPTPLVDLGRIGLYDSLYIFCSGLTTDVLMSGITNATHGIRFRYVIEPFSPADINISYAGPTSDLEVDYQIMDTIYNLSNSVQSIFVIVTPYTIDLSGNEKCSGISDTIYYEVTPGIDMKDWAKSYVFDTLNIRCHGDNSGVIYLNSTGGITAYAAYDFDDLVYQFESSVLPQGTDSVENLTAGLYNLHVEDWSGCIADTNITLNQPDQLESTLQTSADLICSGEIADFLVVPSEAHTIMTEAQIMDIQ
jgi:hypothetical protein